MTKPKTLLDVACALRSAADDIIQPLFPRCYGTLARTEPGRCKPTIPDEPSGDPTQRDPNDPAAKAWCASGRVLYYLGFHGTSSLLGVPGLRHITAPSFDQSRTNEDAATAITRLWVTFDTGATREAAYRMRAIARSIETAIPVAQPARQEAQHAHA